MADISPDAWATAVERLNDVGVFADERSQFPSSQALKQFEDEVRAKGYVGGELKSGELQHPKNGVSFVIFDSSKLSGLEAAVLAWDNEYQTRWHKIVEDRVADWLARLSNLQAKMQSWLPPGMSIVQRSSIAMNEELMNKFSVPPASMPSFDIFNGAEKIMRVQPKGLWIIGANGRVDLITPKSSYILVDKSPPGTDTTDWHYYDSANRRQSTALNETSFVNLLK